VYLTGKFPKITCTIIIINMLNQEMNKDVITLFLFQLQTNKQKRLICHNKLNQLVYISFKGTHSSCLQRGDTVSRTFNKLKDFK
jgi:putative ribosome biogenesis GTPase RsgA